jgi:hypothetical protein
MKAKIQLPEELFEFFAAFYPGLALILDELGLSLNEFFLLSYIRYFGHVAENGQVIILRSQLGDVLDKFLSAGGVSLRIRVLEDKRLIVRKMLRSSEKQVLFGNARGSKSAIVLTKEGLNKLTEFNHRIDELFLKEFANVPRPILNSFLKMLTAMARKRTRSLAHS